MGKKEREKGKRGERMWAAVCREEGYDVRRTSQYCGKSGDAADCIGLPGIHQEVKFVERLNIRDAMEQAQHDAAEKSCGDIPIVAHKKSHEEWLVTMKASDWFKLYREWECGQQKGEMKYGSKTVIGSIPPASGCKRRRSLHTGIDISGVT